MVRRAAWILLAAASALALVPTSVAESGAVLLSPGETAEVPMFNRQYQRIAYRFNVSPEGMPVGFNIHYLKEGGVLYERSPANATLHEGTFFPLRAGPYYLQFRNWDVESTVRVRFEWHPTASVPNTRDVPALGAFAVALVLCGASLVARRNGRL